MFRLSTQVASVIYFFLLNLIIIIVIKKNCPTYHISSIQLNLTHVGWVGLGWTYVMGWVVLNFFLPTMIGWVKKSPQLNPTRLMHTPT